jgi:hypothetical protein
MIDHGTPSLLEWSKITSMDVKPSLKLKDSNNKDIIRTEADVLLNNGKHISVILPDDWATKNARKVSRLTSSFSPLTQIRCWRGKSDFSVSSV